MFGIKIPVKTSIISLLALVVAVVSAAYASSIPAVNVEGNPDWEAFGRSVWIMVLVTIPAVSVFIVMLISALVSVVRSHKK